MHRLLRTSSGKEGPVQDRHGRCPDRIVNGDGEDAGILIVHAVKVDALIRAKVASPRRSQWNRSSDNGQGDPGPLDENAVYVIT